MKHVCRRCLTAFSSQPVLIDHKDRCQKQQPTKITFSWKDQLKFEDYHMKVPVPIRVYADFECINQPQKDPKVLFKQIPIAVGYYVISPFGNYYYSYFETDCTKWFVNRMLTLEKITSKYFKTKLELEMSQEEVQFQLAEECWLCENPLEGEKVRDHDHLTGKYRGAAHNICNINCKQKSSSFVPIFFHNFSGYDCHLIFQELLIQAFEKGYEPKIIPKSLENYVSVQVGCLRFLDSYRFLSSSLNKLVKSLDNFPIMKLEGMSDDLFKKKLAYPYEYLNLDNFQEPLNLTKEDYWSTLTQSYPSDDDIKRTQELIDKNKIKNGRELTMLYLKMDILQLTDVFENSEIKEKTKNFPFCPYQTKADPDLFSAYMNIVNQPNYKPTSKLMCDVTNKSKYMIHYRMFKFYLNQGMKVTKIHTIYRFKQSAWLGKYIDHNTQKRTVAKTNFEKDLYKLMNNAFFGKTKENVRDRTNLEFIDHSQIDQIIKRQSKLSFKGIVDHYSKFSVYKFDKEKTVFDKPIYLGFTLLELSKLLMYEFYYNKLQPYWKQSIQLHYMDTDSFILSFDTSHQELINFLQEKQR